MIGSLGLFKQLSALGRAARGSAVDLNKRAARLPSDARAEFKALRAEEKAKIDAARAEARKRFDEFLAKHKLPPRPDYKKERMVVGAFVEEDSAEGAGLKTNGRSLMVDGREVASRDSMGSKFLKVCPGEFGADKASRRAANAVLDVLGAGINVRDRGDIAVLRAGGRGQGRIVSDKACYTVEVNSRIRKAAAAARQRSLVAEREASYAPGGDVEKYYAELAAREDARLRASGAVDGLGRMHRRRKSRKSRR